MSLSECVCGRHCKQCVVSLSECVCSRHCKQYSWHACQPTVTFTLYCCIVCQFVIIITYVSLCFAVVTVAAQTAPAVAVSVGIIIPLIIVSAMIVVILAGVVFYNKL